MQSDYFKPAALKGLNRIGDVFIPRAGDLPSFSEFGAAGHAALGRRSNDGCFA